MLFNQKLQPWWILIRERTLRLNQLIRKAINYYAMAMDVSVRSKNSKLSDYYT